MSIYNHKLPKLKIKYDGTIYESIPSITVLGWKWEAFR